MKQKKRKPKNQRGQNLVLGLLIFTSTALVAQGNWEDNMGNPSTIKTTTPDPVGIGTSAPDGRTEITYCPTPTPTNGLVVTQDDCTNGAVGVLNPNWGSGTFAGFDPTPGGTGSEVIIQPSVIPWVFRNSVVHTIPIINLITTHNPSPAQPSLPLFWARTKNFDIMSGQKKYSTKFMIMPNGFTGVNTATPRTNLDVVATSGWGNPVAIFGTQAAANAFPASNGLTASFTRHLSVVPHCRKYSFNSISEAGDVGLFFTDGYGQSAASTPVDNGSNLAAGLVIAPWSSDKHVGGMRIASNGDVEMRGNLQVVKVKAQSKWWPDFVFASEYKLMSLSEVESYISQNNHLPNIPSEKEVLENGVDLGEMQTLQQQKIEELTLYTIAQEKKIESQEKLIKEQEERLRTIEQKLNSIL